MDDFALSCRSLSAGQAGFPCREVYFFWNVHPGELANEERVSYYELQFAFLFLQDDEFPFPFFQFFLFLFFFCHYDLLGNSAAIHVVE